MGTGDWHLLNSLRGSGKSGTAADLFETVEQMRKYIATADENAAKNADYISRLEAVVRALDDALRDATAEEIAAMLDVDRGLAWGKLVAARSRVTLHPLTQTNQAKDGDKEDAKIATDASGALSRAGGK